MQDFTVDALVLLVVKYRGNFNSLCNPSVAGLGIAISDPESPPSLAQATIKRHYTGGLSVFL